MKIKLHGLKCLALLCASGLLIGSASFAADLQVKDVKVFQGKAEGSEVRARFRKTPAQTWMLLCFYRPDLIGEDNTSICSDEDSWWSKVFTSGGYAAEMVFKNYKEYGDRLFIDGKKVILSSESFGQEQVGRIIRRGKFEVIVFQAPKMGRTNLRVTDDSVTVFTQEK